MPWAVVAGYVVVFLLLDWASFIRPLQGLNITPWNPQPALAVALLLASRRLWWVVWLSALAAEVIVRGLPGDVFVSAFAAGALTCSYLAMATALQRTLGDGWRLDGRRDVAWFVGVISAGSLLSGAVYIGTFAAGGVVTDSPWWVALARYWIGDAVGLIVTLPIVLGMLDVERRAQLVETLRHREAWVVSAIVCALLWVLFGVLGPDGVGFSYLLLLPVTWASTRFGAAGALLSSALTQVGLIVAMQSAQHQDLLVFELQSLMAAVSMTGLLLGVVVDERRRSDAHLRRSLRLVAAGQMSAALAHELSQPLTALATYAQACQVLARPGVAENAQRQQQLTEVATRIASDALRAGDVVRRLRDFFRAGTTQLEPTDLGALVREAIDAQARRAQASRVELAVEWPDDAPRLWVDAVQLAVVLRNLVANAMDAVAATQGPRRVLVRGQVQDDEMLIDVLDSGPGVARARAARLFDAAASDKPGGMGVGLSISRAIVEAHGGRLWAETGAAGGHFCFTLPLDMPDAREAITEATSHAS